MKTVFKTPVGNIEITGNEKGIESIFITKAPATPALSLPAPLKDARVQLSEYFDGKRKTFDLPLLTPDKGAFTAKVWRELQKIPFGALRTYGEVARCINAPKAARAVGGACNKNPFMIAVPCHRVIGASGRLTGYAGGLDVKEKLLKFEQNSSK